MHTPIRDIRFIKGLSERRRLPRLGKIRLGIKKTGVSGEFPAEVEYFVCPPEVQQVYGPRPTSLKIMLPLEDLGQVFPQAYKWYGTSAGLKCKGDGQIALRRWADVEPPLQTTIKGPHEPNDLVEIPCPCHRLKSGDCGVRGHLMILLPAVSLSGIYQLDTGSSFNLIEINSSIDFLRALLGRIAFVPLTLRREPVKIVYNGQTRVHHLLKLSFDGDLAAVQQLRATAPQPGIPALSLPLPSDEGHGIQNGETPTQPAPTPTSTPESLVTFATPPPPTGAPEPPPVPRETHTTAAPAPTTPPQALGATDAPAPPSPTPPATPTTSINGPPTERPASSPPSAASPSPTCSACNTTISERIDDYSRRFFEAPLCINCQKGRLKKPTSTRR